MSDSGPDASGCPSLPGLFFMTSNPKTVSGQRCRQAAARLNCSQLFFPNILVEITRNRVIARCMHVPTCVAHVYMTSSPSPPPTQPSAVSPFIFPCAGVAFHWYIWEHTGMRRPRQHPRHVFGRSLRIPASWIPPYPGFNGIIRAAHPLDPLNNGSALPRDGTSHVLPYSRSH